MLVPATRLTLAAYCLAIVCLTTVPAHATPAIPEPPQSEDTPPAVDNAKWLDHTQGLPFAIGYEAGLADAKAKDKPVMLFVTATWCGWCKKLAEESFNDPQIRKLLTDNFVLAIVDGDTEPEVVKKLGVDGFPHLIFLDKSGDRVAECPGYAPVSQFKAVVESALGMPGPPVPQLDASIKWIAAGVVGGLVLLVGAIALIKGRSPPPPGTDGR